MARLAPPPWRRNPPPMVDFLDENRRKGLDAVQGPRFIV